MMRIDIEAKHIALAVYQHICGIAYHIEGALNCSLLVFRQIVMNHVVALDVMLSPPSTCP